MSKNWRYQQLSLVYAVCITLFVFLGVNLAAGDELVEGIGMIHVIAPDRTSVNLTHDPIP